MNQKVTLKVAGVASLTVMLVVLAFDGVRTEIVAALATGVLAIVAPDALEQIDWGPF